MLIDPSNHGRLDGHYFHTWSLYVRPLQKQTNALQR